MGTFLCKQDMETEFTAKRDRTFEERLEKANEYYSKFPAKVLMVIERSSGSSLPLPESKKLIVDRNDSVSQVKQNLAGHLGIQGTPFELITADGTRLESTELMKSVFGRHMDEDKYLYLRITEQLNVIEDEEQFLKEKAQAVEENKGFVPIVIRKDGENKDLWRCLVKREMSLPHIKRWLERQAKVLAPNCFMFLLAKQTILPFSELEVPSEAKFETLYENWRNDDGVLVLRLRSEADVQEPEKSDDRWLAEVAFARRPDSKHVAVVLKEYQRKKGGDAPQAFRLIVRRELPISKLIEELKNRLNLAADKTLFLFLRSKKLVLPGPFLYLLIA
eukprot:TRINITY_DN6992_c0_g1_i5.p1 TRINITY_DN6992_c0_g1~~TRINITY_DN6992_c0_g1_i5.p1  ORF type:complete len:333 (-),score=99.52 TRINITY_DN6992_c0_g1_i5:162-1160(-)